MAGGGTKARKRSEQAGTGSMGYSSTVQYKHGEQVGESRGIPTEMTEEGD